MIKTSSLSPFINFLYGNQGEALPALRVSTDTRTLQEKDLWFALSGENFNGAAFAQAALEKKAQGIVLDDHEENRKLLGELSKKYPKALLGVSKVSGCALKSLQKIAKSHVKAWKRRGGTVFGLTGSNGKTTTKEMLGHLLGHILKDKFLMTEGNFNNHIGVPLTLVRLEDHHQFALIEMGTNHPGEIEQLCDIARPEWGFVTNIGDSHLEFFHNRENVLVEKLALYRFIGEKKFFLNEKDPLLKTLSSKENVIRLRDLPVENEFIIGSHNRDNLSYAYQIASFIYPESELDFLEATKTFRPSLGRGEVRKVGSTTFFLDAYNANPSSMRKSLEGFQEAFGSQNCLYILGDMNELGSEARKHHEEIGQFLNSLGVKNAFFIGHHACNFKKGFSGVSQTFLCAQDVAKEQMANYEAIFIKGSNSLQLHQLLDIFDL